MALQAARETEIRRDCARELAGARAEVAKLRAAAAWATRIAADEVECRWREKTEVLLIENARLNERLRSAEAASGQQVRRAQEALQDKEDECDRLREKVRRLEQVERTLNRLQARWAAVEQRDQEETRHLERQAGVAGQPRQSYSDRHYQRRRRGATNITEGNTANTVHSGQAAAATEGRKGGGVEPTRKNMVVEYDANGRRRRIHEARR